MEWREDEHPRDSNGQFAEKISNDNNINSSIIKSSKLYSNDKVIMLPKQEYAELCSAIRTKYTNKIPENGNLLYNDYFYCYNYNSNEERIIFNRKIKISGNEDLINLIRRKYGK